VPDRRAYSDSEIEAAVDKLTEPERLETAQRIVAHSAPQLQRVRALIADETRVSMLVGVAVGLELGHLLLDATTARVDAREPGETPER
jgi:hypothetical protein